MKKLDLSDHRAVREYLTDEDYGLPGDKPYEPKGVISPKAWASITRLPDTVALMTTDGYSRAIPVMQSMASAWSDIHDAMPDKSPMQSQCLAAYECFEGAIFNAVHGWYRVAGIAIRNAVEDIIVGLYYQNQPGKRTEFETVTTGQARSAGRRDIDRELVKYAPQGLVDRVNALYQDELSIYVHRMSDGELWEGSNGPVFVQKQFDIWIEQYERAFRLLCELIETVIPGSGVVKIADAIQFEKS